MTERELDILGRTGYGEVSGEEHDGIAAFAWVVKNRVGKYGKDIIDVCLKPLQFSCWNMNDPNRQRILRVEYANPDFLRVLTICSMVFAGRIPDLTKGSNHYYNPLGVTKTPDWADESKFTVKIGAHKFYKL